MHLKLAIGLGFLMAIFVLMAVLLVRFLLQLFLDLKQKRFYEKLVNSISWAIVIVALLASSYYGGTLYKTGDYSHLECSWGDDAVVVAKCKRSLSFSSEYYCQRHFESWLSLEDLDGARSDSSSSSSRSGPEDSYGHNKYDAMTVAEKLVKQRLKSPSTADFCGNSDYSISCSGNTWTVRGWVDAQNSFGAILRNNFTVKFTFTSSSNYTIDSVDIN